MRAFVIVWSMFTWASMLLSQFEMKKLSLLKRLLNMIEPLEGIVVNVTQFYSPLESFALFLVFRTRCLSWEINISLLLFLCRINQTNKSSTNDLLTAQIMWEIASFTFRHRSTTIQILTLATLVNSLLFIERLSTRISVHDTE